MATYQTRGNSADKPLIQANVDPLNDIINSFGKLLNSIGIRNIKLNNKITGIQLNNNNCYGTEKPENVYKGITPKEGQIYFKIDTKSKQ